MKFTNMLKNKAISFLAFMNLLCMTLLVHHAFVDFSFYYLILDVLFSLILAVLSFFVLENIKKIYGNIPIRYIKVGVIYFSIFLSTMLLSTLILFSKSELEELTGKVYTIREYFILKLEMLFYTLSLAPFLLSKVKTYLIYISKLDEKRSIFYKRKAKSNKW